jgi:hypothetical protein
MKSMINITGRKVTKKALGIITDDFIRLMNAGAEAQLEDKTVRHAITALKEVVVNTASPANVSLSNLHMNAGEVPENGSR